MKSAIDGGISPRSVHACASSAAISSVTARDQPCRVEGHYADRRTAHRASPRSASRGQPGHRSSRARPGRDGRNPQERAKHRGLGLPERSKANGTLTQLHNHLRLSISKSVHNSPKHSCRRHYSAADQLFSHQRWLCGTHELAFPARSQL
jgi:hypothetical protein